jgi:hypothetical protein
MNQLDVGQYDGLSDDLEAHHCQIPSRWPPTEKFAADFLKLGAEGIPIH